MAVGYGRVGGMVVTFLLVDLVKLLYLSAHTCILVPIPLGYGYSFSSSLLSAPCFMELLQCSRFSRVISVLISYCPLYLVSLCVVVLTKYNSIKHLNYNTYPP